jgi:hypothetical protein
MNLTIRLATPVEEWAVRWLAASDCRPRPSGDLLLAERDDGAPVAAMSLTTGASISDPFADSEDAVRLLRRRRYQLLRQGGNVTPMRSLRRGACGARTVQASRP